MRDATIEALNDYIYHLDEQEAEAPICEICGCKDTYHDYYYNINGEVICPECIDTWLEQWKQII